MSNEAHKVIHFSGMMRAEKTEKISAFDAFCLATGLKVMKLNPQSKDLEPRWSVIAWLTIAVIIALFFVVWFFGKAVGREEGLQKGKEEATIQNLQKQLDILQKQKADEERTQKNIKLAQELTEAEKQKEKK